jgi:hypothetical protein
MQRIRDVEIGVNLFVSMTAPNPLRPLKPVNSLRESGHLSCHWFCGLTFGWLTPQTIDIHK